MSNDRLRRVALVVWTAVGLAVCAFVLIRVAGAVRVIWLPMAFAFGLVLLLEPSVRWMERRGVHRFIATALSFLGLVAFLVAITALVYPTVQRQVTDFAQRLPDLYEGILAWLEETAGRIGIDLGSFLGDGGALADWLNDPANQETIRNLLIGFGSGAGHLIKGVTEAVAVALLAPVLALYLLIDLPRFKQNAIGLTPPALRDEVVYVSRDVARAMGSFVRGQLLVALIVGVASSIGMFVIGLPFWLLVGIISGLLNMIPFLGPVTGGALAFIISLLNNDPWQGVVAVIIYTVIQQIDNHLITPLIQRTRVHLSPFAIVIALIIGGSVAGLLGVLVAVPATAAIRIVAGHLWRTRILGQSWREASEAMIEETPPPERLARLARRTDQEKLFDTVELEQVSVPTPDDED